MWSIRSHKLAPLTNLTSSKVKFLWTQIKLDAFDEIKQVVAHNTLLSCPDFNEELKIYTDASDFLRNSYHPESQTDRFL